ncbi:hypothetical protein FKW77_000906 [Venturia effusa]|uniref:Uncharacterized protein n=1 Tax=Venturia effusa TaxID=50376 RepID=A0A517KVR2_9PEZI|nr:hypothetical protein FKW77_000906 [Venturia effusa]
MAAKDQNGDSTAEFAKAFKELQKGEQTAAALENHLTSLEKKIDDLLASAEANQSTVDGMAEPSKEEAESAEDKRNNAEA